MMTKSREYTMAKKNTNEGKQETLEEKLDFVIKLLAMNIMKDIDTNKEKVHFLQNVIGLNSSKISFIMNKTTKELSQYLYDKKQPKKSKNID